MKKLVYVVNKNEKPLMPCKASKAKKLLKNEKAEVFEYEPFTIKLKFGASGYKNKVVLGIDTGSSNIGIAAVCGNRVLFQAEAKTKTSLIVDRMTKRASYRRTRRNRKTRYRKPRFDNRKRKDGWLPPSIQENVEMHIKMIKMVNKILPVTKIIIETAQFDTHALKEGKYKLNNFEYQKGPLYKEENLKMYIRKRDKYLCQMPKCKEEKGVLECHHIIPRRKGGTNKPENLILLCEKCHKKITGKEEQFIDIFYSITKGKRINTKDFARTQAGKTKIVELAKTIAPVEQTIGAITKVDRKKIGLPKTHYNDAVAIASQGRKIKTLNYYYKFVNKGRGQYQLRKGIRSQMIAQSPEREIEGFKRWDKVKVIDTGEIGFINRKRTSGQFGISDIEGKTIYGSKTFRKLKKISSGKSILCEMKKIPKGGLK